MTRARGRACVVESLYYLWLVSGFTMVFTGGAWLFPGLVALVGATVFNHRRRERARRAGPTRKCIAAWSQFWTELGIWLITMLGGPWLLASHRTGAVVCGAVMIAGGVASIWFGHDCDADCGA